LTIGNEHAGNQKAEDDKTLNAEVCRNLEIKIVCVCVAAKLLHPYGREGGDADPQRILKEDGNTVAQYLYARILRTALRFLTTYTLEAFLVLLRHDGQPDDAERNRTGDPTLLSVRREEPEEEKAQERDIGGPRPRIEHADHRGAQQDQQPEPDIPLFPDRKKENNEGNSAHGQPSETVRMHVDRHRAVQTHDSLVLPHEPPRDKPPHRFLSDIVAGEQKCIEEIAHDTR